MSNIQNKLQVNGSEEENEEGGKTQLTEFMERTKYIPLRLTLSERKVLRLCEAALNVSSRYLTKHEYITTIQYNIMVWRMDKL